MGSVVNERESSATLVVTPNNEHNGRATCGAALAPQVLCHRLTRPFMLWLGQATFSSSELATEHAFARDNTHETNEVRLKTTTPQTVTLMTRQPRYPAQYVNLGARDMTTKMYASTRRHGSGTTLSTSSLSPFFRTADYCALSLSRWTFDRNRRHVGPPSPFFL